MGVRKMTNTFMVNTLTVAKFRKIKSVMLVEALRSGSAIRGNHRVEYGYLNDIHVFEFYYRHTKILKVNILANGEILTEDVYAGDYDNTPATMRQRQDIHSAVAEIKSLLSLKVCSCGY
jgi:hypothetical protein